MIYKTVIIIYARIYYRHITASDLAYFVSKCLGLGWERFLLWPDSPNHIIVLWFFSTSGHIVSPQVEVFRRLFTWYFANLQITLEDFYCEAWALRIRLIFSNIRKWLVLNTTLNSALAIQRLDWGAGPRVVWACYTMQCLGRDTFSKFLN